MRLAGRRVRRVCDGLIELPNVREGRLDERPDVRVAQRVLPRAADAPHADDRVVAQHPKLVRDRGLLHPYELDDLGDPVRAGLQRREDPEPAGSPQSEHGVRDPLRGSVVELTYHMTDASTFHAIGDVG